MLHVTDEMEVVKGTLQVHDKAITSQQKKVVDLTARSMARNIIISGIDEVLQTEENENGVTENCKEKALDFLRTKLKMELEDSEIEVAHRIGKSKNQKTRQMVVRCKQE